MPLDFTKCEECGKIFLQSAIGQTLCPACQGISAELSDKDLLRQLKNTLRDVQARGEFLNIAQLTEESQVAEDKIWHFINTGELSTASLDDPAVRDYLVRKKRELAKQAKQPKEKKDEGDKRKFYSKKQDTGFHLSTKDGPKK